MDLADCSCLPSSRVFAPVSNIIVQDKDENDDLGGPTAEERSYCRQFIDDEESCDVSYLFK